MKFRLPPPYRADLKFTAPAVDGVFLGYSLQPGSVWKGDYFAADLKEFESADPTMMKVQVHTIKEVNIHGHGFTFPLREAKDTARQKRLAERAAQGDLDELSHERAVGSDKQIPDEEWWKAADEDENGALDPVPEEDVLKIPFLRKMSRKAGCLCQFRVAVGSFCLVFRLE